MPRRNSFLNDLLDLVEKLLGFYILYIVYLFIADRAAFWNNIIWLVVGIIFVVALVFVWERYKLNKRATFNNDRVSDAEYLRRLKNLHPNEFEEFIARLFNKLGFKTEVWGGSHDGGIDVVAEKDGIKHYIQCKKFITQQVSVGAVRDFWGAVTHELAKGKSYFITTNYFTLEAEHFAKDENIELVDGNILMNYVRMAEKNGGPIELPNTSSRCPNCGGNLVEKNGKYGKFFGCSNYPKCNYTKSK